MITSNHIDYLKHTLEAEDKYSHPELYAWSEFYIKAHNVPLEYADSRRSVPEHLHRLMKDFPWHHRYNSLVQHGTFYCNIVRLAGIRRDALNEEDWKIALDLEGIPCEMANFEICYCWMCPGRWFTYDWRSLSVDPGTTPPFPSVKEADEWDFVDKIYQKIASSHLPMCTVDEFMAKKI